jgi:membrane-associated protease RseP (regulator of RpoE activity)
LVITAGSLMHAVIAFALFFGVYVTAGRYAQTGEVKISFPPAADSPAASAGIQEGDVVLSFNGVDTTTREQLVDAITSRSPGEAVQLEIRRDNQVMVLQATLAANPVDESVAYFGVGSWSMDYVQQNLISSLGFAASDVVVDAANSVKGVFTVLNPVNIVSNVTSSNADPMTRPSTVVGASQIGGEVGKQEGLKGVLMLLWACSTCFRCCLSTEAMRQSQRTSVCARGAARNTEQTWPRWCPSPHLLLPYWHCCSLRVCT